MSNLAKWNVKVIITCRTQYLFGDYKYWFAPMYSETIVKRDELMEI